MTTRERFFLPCFFSSHWPAFQFTINFYFILESG